MDVRCKNQKTTFLAHAGMCLPVPVVDGKVVFIVGLLTVAAI